MDEHNEAAAIAGGIRQTTHFSALGQARSGHFASGAPPRGLVRSQLLRIRTRRFRGAIARLSYALVFVAAILRTGLATAQEAPDESDSNVEIRVFSLNNASSARLLQVLQQVFADQNISLAADERTNTVVVKASPSVLRGLEPVLRQLDEQPSVRGSREESAQGGGQEVAPRNPPAAPQARAPVPEAADGLAIRNEVSGSTTVRWLVPEGMQVKKGDLLVELDDSKFDKQLKRLQIELAAIEGRVAKAEQGDAVEETVDLEILRLTVELARTRRECFEAQLKLELNAMDGQVAVATESLQFARARSERLKQLFAIGQADANDPGAAALEVRKAEVDLETTLAKKELLVQQTRRLKLAELELEQKRAESELKRAEHETAARRARDEANRSALRAQLTMKREEGVRLNEMRDKCKIHAPAPGVVQYGIPRPGGRRSLMRQGAIVREGQTLMTLQQPE